MSPGVSERPAQELHDAVRLLHAGRRSEAESICVDLQARQPDNPQVLALLAIIRAQSGQPQEAIALFERARAIAPDDAALHFNLGNLLREQGRRGEAIDCYRRACELRPSFHESLNNLARTLQESGQLTEAIETYRRLLHVRPIDAAARTNLGCALMEQGSLTEAVGCFRQIAELRPQDHRAWFNLGNALRAAGRIVEAVETYRRALSLSEFADGWFNLANALRDLGELPNAIDSYRCAIALEPAHLPARNNLGSVLRTVGQPLEALRIYEQVLAVEPENAVANLNAGNALLEAGHPEQAIGRYRHALAADPHHVDCLLQLGNALRRTERFDEALNCYGKVLAADPDQVAARAGTLLTSLEVWDWQTVESIWEYLRLRLTPEHALPAQAFQRLSASLAEHERGAAALARRIAAEIPDDVVRTGFTSQRPRGVPGRTARVAYVSPDFHDHPVGFSIAGMLEHHDRSRFHVIGLSLGAPAEDATRARILTACDEFHDVSLLASRSIVELMREREIDIAIDLAGYTARSRPAVFAHRGAPIQVAYLGFPGTTGAPWIDYLLADRFVVPEASTSSYAEKIAWLPECFFPSEPLGSPLEPHPDRAAEGLPGDAVVLCCFNQIGRVTAQLLASWARVLRRVPSTVLWLRDPGERARENVVRFMRERRVETDRLIFAPKVPTRARHLARHRLADLYLDTFPYNSHSTGRDALQAGLPLLTLSGETFPSRVAGSMLTTLGLSGLIAYEIEEYEQRAVALAAAPRELRALREELARNCVVSPLFDIERLTRHIEDAYEQMLARYRAGHSPDHLSIVPRLRP